MTAENLPKSPVRRELEAGKTYFLCACGLSQDLPFCDGSHRATSKRAQAFTPSETKMYAMCACGKTGKPPFCDGSHRKISTKELHSA